MLERIVADKRRRWPDATITVEVAPGLPPARWDESSFELVTRNLISNAIKYGDGTEIRVCAAASGNGIELTVADGGPGLPTDDVGRVFDLFFRADDARRRAQGAGIGLFVVRALVEFGRRDGLGGQPADRRGGVRVPDPGVHRGRRPARRGVATWSGSAGSWARPRPTSTSSPTSGPGRRSPIDTAIPSARLDHGRARRPRLDPPPDHLDPRPLGPHRRQRGRGDRDRRRRSRSTPTIARRSSIRSRSGRRSRSRRRSRRSSWPRAARSASARSACGSSTRPVTRRARSASTPWTRVCC